MGRLVRELDLGECRADSGRLAVAFDGLKERHDVVRVDKVRVELRAARIRVAQALLDDPYLRLLGKDRIGVLGEAHVCGVHGLELPEEVYIPCDRDQGDDKEYPEGSACLFKWCG